jgi:hypothetical protein
MDYGTTPVMDCPLTDNILSQAHIKIIFKDHNKKSEHQGVR